MFKKLISLWMVLAIFSVSASASTAQSLKAVMDEFNYSLTVEWDQKDQPFLEAQVAKFSSNINQLYMEGMTTKDLLSYIKSEIKDQRVATELDQIFKVVASNKMSNAEAIAYVNTLLKTSYNSGANWNGEIVIVMGMSILVGIAAANWWYGFL